MYASLITIVAIILFLIALLILLLILYVILRSMIVSLKTDFGIYKAMGFTSNQLIIQTVGSITPFIFFGALLSAVLGTLYLPVLFDGIFSVIGILLCRPIKNITAYSLIKE